MCCIRIQKYPESMMMKPMAAHDQSKWHTGTSTEPRFDKKHTAFIIKRMLVANCDQHIMYLDLSFLLNLYTVLNHYSHLTGAFWKSYSSAVQSMVHINMYVAYYPLLETLNTSLDLHSLHMKIWRGETNSVPSILYCWHPCIHLKENEHFIDPQTG